MRRSARVSFCTVRKPTGTYDRSMLNLSRGQWAGVWCGAVLVLSAGAVAAGVGITFGNIVLVLLACLAPPAVMLLVWRGPPPQTVAELLHDANAPATGDRR
jgi:hypothetical protein